MVFLTGGYGFIGKYLIEEFKKNKIKLNYLSKKDFNINNKNHIKKLPKNTKVVIHAAALCGAKESNENYENFMNTNFEGTKNILFEMLKKNIKNIIFFSSLTVFGFSRKAVNEKSSFKKRHVYSLTKSLSEEFLEFFCKKNKINCIILRPTLVVGKGYKEPHAIGDFVDTIKKDKEIKIFGNGNHKRDFVHPKDVAIATLNSYRNIIKKKEYFDTFNLNNNEKIKMIDLAKLVIAKAKKGSYKIVNPTSQTFSLYTNSKKARRILNYIPKYNNSYIIDELL